MKMRLTSNKSGGRGNTYLGRYLKKRAPRRLGGEVNERRMRYRKKMKIRNGNHRENLVAKMWI